MKKEKKNRITVSLSPSVWKRIQKEARKNRVSASALAELMLEAGLARLEKEQQELFERLVG